MRTSPFKNAWNVCFLLNNNLQLLRKSFYAIDLHNSLNITVGVNQKRKLLVFKYTVMTVIIIKSGLSSLVRRDHRNNNLL